MKTKKTTIITILYAALPVLLSTATEMDNLLSEFDNRQKAIISHLPVTITTQAILFFLCVIFTMMFLITFGVYFKENNYMNIIAKNISDKSDKNIQSINNNI